MSEVTVSQLTPNQKVNMCLLIKSVEFKTSKNDSMYTDFTLADVTGEINAKLWNYHPDFETMFKAGTPVHVEGTVTQWKDSLQLRVDSLRPVGKADNVDISALVPSAPYPAEVMFDSIYRHAEEITDSDLRRLVITILNENKERLMYWPAAKSNHHAVRSGLLYHTVTMLRAGLMLAKLYDWLNTDLICAGVILHDIDKLNEMNSDALGIVDEYTTHGKLLGHLVGGAIYVAEVGKRLGIPEEKLLIIEHMEISHHDKPEYGSPVRPMFPEAELLHRLDNLDSRMYEFRDKLKNVEDGGFTERVYSLDSRMLYKIPADLFGSEEE